MSNKLGYILGFSSAFIYTIISNGINFYYFSDFLASFIGPLLIPAGITGLISIFLKDNNSGKVFGITCITIYILAGIGNSII